METLAGALSRRDSSRKRPSTPSTTPSTAICSLLSKQIFLHDWWLIKTDSDSHGKGLGVGGFNHRESRGIRSFSSAPIVTRRDTVTLETVDGITILLHGHINRSRTLENGFSREVNDDFLIGFPYYWEEFAGASVSEEPTNSSVSKGISCPDACNILNKDYLDDALKTNYDDLFWRSGARKWSSQLRESKETPLKRKKVNTEQSNVEDVVVRSGPLTRSRTRKS